MNVSRWPLAAGTLLMSVGSAAACPFCETETGEQVRAGVFNEDFAYHLGVMLLPFALLLLVAGVIHLGVPLRAKSSDPGGPHA